jgi:peptidoglycan/LPS O-acetylase OafA/YrhL
MPWLASWTSPSARIEWLRAPVTSISLWSYAIYLCHHMILLGMSAWIGGDAAPASVKLLGKVLALGMILLVSFLVHRGYESPLTRRRPPELRDRGEPATAPVLVD